MFWKNCPALSVLFNKNSMNADDLSLLKSREAGTFQDKQLFCCEVKPLNLPTAPACGIQIKDRIVGGENASITDFPWAALMEFTYRKFYYFE